MRNQVFKPSKSLRIEESVSKVMIHHIERYLKEWEKSITYSSLSMPMYFAGCLDKFNF